MKSLIITLADSVNMYEGGKLVICGTFDRVISPEVPFAFRPFGIAIKIAAEKKDFGKIYETQLVIRKKGSTKVNLQLPVTMQFKKPVTKDGLVHAVFAYNIMSINFESFGVHIVELRKQNASGKKDVLASFEFIVEKQKASKKTTTKKASKKR